MPNLPRPLITGVLCCLIAAFAVAGYSLATASPQAPPMRLPTPSPGTPTAP